MNLSHDCAELVAAHLSPSDVVFASAINTAMRRLFTPFISPVYLTTFDRVIAQTLGNGVQAMKVMLSGSRHIHGFHVTHRRGVTRALQRMSFDPFLPPLWLVLEMRRGPAIHLVATLDHGRRRMFPVFQLTKMLHMIHGDGQGQVFKSSRTNDVAQHEQAVEALRDMYPRVSEVCHTLLAQWNEHKQFLVPDAVTTFPL